MNRNTDFTPFTKINSKWIINQNLKHKTKRLLENNIGENLNDLGYSDFFLDSTPKTQSMKEIIDKLDFTKI